MLKLKMNLDFLDGKNLSIASLLVLIKTRLMKFVEMIYRAVFF